MTFPRHALALAALLVAAGCSNDLDWRTVVPAGTSTGVGRFRWRNAHELWAWGGDVLRRTDGAWESLSICPPRAPATGLTFDHDDVWVFCDGYMSATLVHYDAATNATVERLPFDGNLELVDMTSGVVLVGEMHVWRWNGTAFESYGPAPTVPGGDIGACAGRSPTDIYCRGGYFDGTSWASVVDMPTAVAPYERDGEVYATSGRLTAGRFEEWAGETGRPLAPVELLPPSTVYWLGNDGEHLYLWRGAKGGGPSEFLGEFPGPATTGPYSATTLGLYVVDSGTFVETSAFVSGLSGTSSFQLLEGHL